MVSFYTPKDDVLVVIENVERSKERKIGRDMRLIKAKVRRRERKGKKHVKKIRIIFWNAEEEGE